MPVIDLEIIEHHLNVDFESQKIWQRHSQKGGAPPGGRLRTRGPLP